MVAPLVAPAVLAALAESLKGGMEAYSSGKASKRDAKEKKRKTLADMLNASLERGHDTGKENRRNQNELSGAW